MWYVILEFNKFDDGEKINNLRFPFLLFYDLMNEKLTKKKRSPKMSNPCYIKDFVIE